MLHPIKASRRAFTLIELIAVVVILAILAGVALPRYFDYAAQAKESATRGSLGGVRAGVANFFANEAINGAARYPTLIELTTTGTVMQEIIPENPYKQSNGVRADTWNAGAPPVDSTATEGWNYDVAVGKFWANTNTVGENTW